MKGRRVVALVYAATVAASAVAVSSVVTRTPEPERARRFIFKKAGADREPGANKRALIGPMDSRFADYTADVEAYLLRAYPQAEIPGEATIAAQQGWGALNAAAHSSGAWQLIGPSKATYPGVLDPFLFDGAQYVASGRVTAMAIAPTCTQASCTLYVAAAGGGVWRTDKALTGSNWQFVSASLGTNAIGSLLMDPSDA